MKNLVISCDIPKFTGSLEMSILTGYRIFSTLCLSFFFEHFDFGSASIGHESFYEYSDSRYSNSEIIDRTLIRH